MSHADSKSSSEQEQQQSAQTNKYNFPYPQHFEDNTIDLYELWITLWNRKWLVFAVTVAVTLGSLVYSLQRIPIYKTEALVFPPKGKDFQSMNLIGIVKKTGISIGTQLDSAEVFSRFLKNLNSRSIQKKFIQENGLMEILAPNRNAETSDLAIYSGFADLIKLEDKNGITSVSIEMHDPEIAARWINDLIELADKETITILMENLRNSIENHIRKIEYSISSKRLMAEKRREDQIIRYTEHAEIAKKLGMIGQDVRQRIQSTQLNVEIAMRHLASTPLYYLGYEALMTEIGILRNRKSDDPFIPGLRDLQEQLALLRSLNFDQEKMSSVFIDQAAYPPKRPIKINRKLNVSIATVVGLFSGIFLVFFIEFVQKQRKKHLG